MRMLASVDHNFLFSSKGMAFYGIRADSKYILINFDFIDTNFPRERKSRFI